MTMTRCAVCATTPRSCVIRISPVPSSRCRSTISVEDLRLDRDVERGGRLVRDQQAGPAGQRHRDHHALAHAAGKLVRIFLRALRRLGDADEVAAARPPALQRLPCGHAPMQAQRFGDLVADRNHRVERGHRLLEDHRDRLPRIARISASLEAEQVGAFERHRAADDPARRVRHQPHDRQRGHALAAAGLADDRQRLARGDAERRRRRPP